MSAAPLEFTKMQSAGNDLIVIDASGLPDRDWPATARALCRRRYGIGSDGMMVIDRPADMLRIRMFNPDGSEDMCGNGTLCASAFARTHGLLTADAATVLTLVGETAVRFDSPDRPAVRLGAARFEDGAPLHTPVEVGDETVTLSAVNTGTPHAVVHVDALPDDATFLRLAQKIETHPLFPDKASVDWMAVESPTRIHLRIWERGGVGESLSCGTGACAAAAVGQRLGWLADAVTVVSKGGELSVTRDTDGALWLSGQPKQVFRGW